MVYLSHYLTGDYVQRRRLRLEAKRRAKQRRELLETMALVVVAGFGFPSVLFLAVELGVAFAQRAA